MILSFFLGASTSPLSTLKKAPFCQQSKTRFLSKDKKWPQSVVNVIQTLRLFYSVTATYFRARLRDLQRTKKRASKIYSVPNKLIILAFSPIILRYKKISCAMNRVIIVFFLLLGTWPHFIKRPSPYVHPSSRERLDTVTTNILRRPFVTLFRYFVIPVKSTLVNLFNFIA